MISAVIFDFDGVLADTEPLHFAAFVDAFRPRGWTLEEKAYFDRYLGFDDRGVVRAFATDHALPLSGGEEDRIVEDKTHAFARLIETRNVLYPETAACVGALVHRFRLGIASGALRREIALVLTAGSLLHAFPVIVGADDVEETKPSPVPYLEAASRLGVAPRECIAIEDSRWGLAAARAAGMKTIALPTTSPRHLLVDADRIIGTLAELTVDLLAGFDRAALP